MNAKRNDKSSFKGAAAIEGIVEGLTGILDWLQQVWGQGGEVTGRGETGKGGAQGVCGFAVKVGLGTNAAPKVEPCGTVHPDKKTEGTRIREIYEPVADIFEAADHTLVG